MPLRERSVLSVSEATITKHQTGGLNSRNLFSHWSGGWKSQIKVSAGLVSSEAPLLGLQMAAFLPGPQSFVCVHMP